MIRKLRGRVSSAHVIALAALFVALGGTAFAAATIDTNDIENGAVTEKKLHDLAVTTRKLDKLAVTTARLAGSAVTTKKLADRAVLTRKLADLAVKTRSLADQAVTTKKLAEGAVGTEKIADNAVNSAKVADGTLTGADVADDSLTGADLAESTLGQVPSALTAPLGGKGRYSGTFVISCDPESTTFEKCRSQSISLSAPARLLVIGTALIEDEPGDVDSGRGSCQIGVTGFGPIPDSATSGLVKASGSDRDNERIVVMGVTGVLPIGTHTVEMQCNQSPVSGAVFYTQAQVTAVALSAD